MSWEGYTTEKYRGIKANRDAIKVGTKIINQHNKYGFPKIFK